MDIQEIHNFHKQKRLFPAIVIILGIFLITLIISNMVGIQNEIKEGRYIGQDVESKHTITVTDVGEVYAKPDLAVIDLSVITEATTVEAAMNENTGKMNAVIDVAKGLGIEDKDLKTTSFAIYPRYDYMQGAFYPSGKRVLSGYEVRQQLQVKIRELDKIGQIIGKTTNAGANQIGDLQFTIDNQDELEKQARGQAIEKAKAKAEELASQLGVKLVRIIGFGETGSIPRLAQYGYDAIKAEGLGGVPNIETGENKISASVSITYEID